MTRRVCQTLQLENSTYVTVAACQYMADAFRSTFPAGKLTWALEHQTVTATGKADVRAFVAGQRATYGDGVALYSSFSMCRQSTAAAAAELSTLVPALLAATGETEPAMFAWAIPAAVLPTAISLGIRVAAGQTWGQANTDGYSGEGSPNVPYYPSANHFLSPAREPGNALDVVMLDTLSSAYWESLGGRATIHPIDAQTLARMQAITVDYLVGTVTQPSFPMLTAGCEIAWIFNTTYNNPVIYQSGNYYARDRLVDWWEWLGTTYGDLQMVTMQELGAAWRALHPFASGNQWRASVTSANPADAAQTVTWEFSPVQRVGIVVTPAGRQLVDLTYYADSTQEPAPITTINSQLEPGQTWSLPQVVSQKRSHITATGTVRARSEGRPAFT